MTQVSSQDRGCSKHRLIRRVGETEIRGAGIDSGDFLARERAALGDDAELFTSGNEPRQTTVEDGDDDLLGGDFGGSSQPQAGQYDELDTFESSFPAVDTSNAVSRNVVVI